MRLLKEMRRSPNHAKKPFPPPKSQAAGVFPKDPDQFLHGFRMMRATVSARHHPLRFRSFQMRAPGEHHPIAPPKSFPLPRSPMIEGHVTARRPLQICHLTSLVRHRDKHHAPHRGQEREFQTLFDLLFAPRNPRNLGKGAA